VGTAHESKTQDGDSHQIPDFITPGVAIQNSGENKKKAVDGVCMDAILGHLFAIFIRLGGFGLLILGVLDSSFLFMPLGNDLLMVALTAREHKLLPVFAAMATAGSVLGCWLVDRIARKGGEEGLDRIVSRRQLEFVKGQVRNRAGWAIVFASLMPPPFPFTPIVAAASAFQYPSRKLLGQVSGGAHGNPDPGSNLRDRQRVLDRYLVQARPAGGGTDPPINEAGSLKQSAVRSSESTGTT
jgi:membrane protein YqaA with SNARE-associated domain